MVLGILGLSGVALAGFLIRFGYRWAVNELAIDGMQVEAERLALDQEWQALQQTRRVRAVFFEARQAMRAQAHRSTTQNRRK